MPSQKRMKGKARAAAAGKPKSQATMSAQQLFDHAQQALMFDRYNEAKDFFRRALKLEPHNLEFLDTYGAVLAEVGPPDEALQVLQTALQVSPDAGFEKYMYLGQLCEGDEAVQHVRKGISILESELQQAQAEGAGGGAEEAEEAEEQVAELSAQLCSALCSLAELLMEQATEVAQVSGDVSAALNRALAVCPGSPEPLQALASLRYEEGRPEEALHLLQQSMSKWFKPQKEQEQQQEKQQQQEQQAQQQEAAVEPVLQKPKAAEELSDDYMGSGEGMEEGSEEEEEEEEELPSYEFRFECAKLLLELDDTTEVAIEVLEDLLQEDDSVLDVWHLLGLSYYSGHEYDDAAEIVAHGMKLMEKQGVGAEEEIASSFAELHGAVEEARALQQQDKKQ